MKKCEFEFVSMNKYTYLHSIEMLPWHTTGQELPQDDSIAVDVGPLVVPLAAEDLGRHPLRGATSIPRGHESPLPDLRVPITRNDFMSCLLCNLTLAPNKESLLNWSQAYKLEIIVESNDSPSSAQNLQS